MPTEPKTSCLDHVRRLCAIGPRPLGSKENQRAAAYLQGVLEACGLEIESQEFPCPLWEELGTTLTVGEEKLTAVANSFSPPCDVTASTVAVGTMAELETAQLRGKIGLLYGELSKGHGILGAKSAFYFPEPAQKLLRLLEEKKPAALITVHAQIGSLERLIRSWDLSIPSATVSAEAGLVLLRRSSQPVRLQIASRQRRSQFRSVIARKAGRRPERIVLLAHLDTLANTVGAFDNASGLAVLAVLAESLSSEAWPVSLEWFITNGEENGGVGDAEYLRRRADEMGQIIAAINVDGVGHFLSATSIALMGGSEAFQDLVAQVIANHAGVVRSEPWYESDHTAFFSHGVPCLPITSAGVAESFIHTPADMPEWLSADRLDQVVSLITEIIEGLQDKTPAWSRA
jgi:Iap family predicted aminopeptidase